MRFRSFTLLLLLVAVCISSPAQSTIHVPADQPTIQAGINAAQNGDTVLVAPGTYNENIDFLGKAITVTSSGGAATTVLRSAIYAPTVLFTHGETRASILSGLTISGGGVNPVLYTAGAIYLDYAAATIQDNIITDTQCAGVNSFFSSPLIRRNRISNTHVPPGHCDTRTVGEGVGISIYRSLAGIAPLVVSNVIENNGEGNGALQGGGGIDIDYTRGWDSADTPAPIIASNIIRFNTPGAGVPSSTYGGGVALFDAGGTLVNNLIYGNAATGSGGGVSLVGSSGSTPALLINNTISDNAVNVNLPSWAFTPVGGSQVFSSGGQALTLINNIITGTSGMSLITCNAANSSNPLTFTNNDLWNKAGPLVSDPGYGSCSEPTGSGGNISVDPLFLSSANGDYHPATNSPAVDSGSNSAVQIASSAGVDFTEDLENHARVVDATHKGTAIIDMGAYELSGQPPTTAVLSCSPLSVSIGQTSMLILVVTASTGTVLGSATLSDNSSLLGQLPLDSGSATYTYTGQSVGSHVLTATYPGSANLAASTATCTITVTGLPTSAVLHATPAMAAFGSATLLTANVTPSTLQGTGVPTGQVTFLREGTVLGTATLQNGVASFSAADLPGGTDQLTCTYAGDSIYGASACNRVPVTITAAPTTLTLTPSVNPALSGTPFSVTVHLAAGNGAPLPPGETVQLVNPLGFPITLTLDASGSATQSVVLPVIGTVVLTATFAGDTNLQPSTAVFGETVDGVVSSTNLTATPNPAYQNQEVILTATLALSGSQTPAGSLTFYDGATSLGTAALSNAGQAVLSSTMLAPGSHSLTATFNGTGPFLSSTSKPILETILPSTFAVTLTPATLTLHGGQGATVTTVLTSVGGFAGPLTLSAGPWPTYATGSFSPGALTLTAAGTGQANLVLTTAQEALNDPAARPGAKPWPILFAVSLLLPCSLTRFRRLRRLLAFATIAVLTQTLTGCGTVGVPFHLVPAGTYRIPITATDAAHHQQSATLTLTVAP